MMLNILLLYFVQKKEVFNNNNNNNNNENRGVTRNASCYIIITVFTIQ